MVLTVFQQAESTAKPDVTCDAMLSQFLCKNESYTIALSSQNDKSKAVYRRRAAGRLTGWRVVA